MSRLTPDAEVPFFCETALQQKTKEASELTALEELLSKTEYIYVIGTDGRPQMPTKRKRHVLKLLNTGKARIAEKVPFTIQLKYDNIPVLQPVILAADPGRTNIGVTALSPFGDLMFTAVIETRNKEIKKLMADRKSHRQASRRGERKARQRLAKKYGTMIKAGMIMRKLPQYAADKFVTCNVIRNTEARFCNRKRCSDWLTPTVNHLAQTHLNVIKKISRYLPVTDIAIEVNRFAFMQMENPNASGVDFQNGPLRGFDDVKAAIREQQNGKCLMCKNDIEHFHHMVPLSKGGSDTIQNQVGLCPKCHAKAHTEQTFKKKLKDKKSGLLKKYGALSALNQAIPFICKDLLAEYGKEHVHFCTGKETSLIRTSLGYEKTKDNQMHEVDAYCIGLASLELKDIKLQSFVNTYKIKQFRRQDRSIIHHQTKRSYYLDEQKIATNRKPRFEQTGNALSDWYKKQVKACDKAKADKMLSTLKVKKSSRSYNSEGRLMPGAVFSYNGQRHVMSGQLTGGRYLRAYGDTKTNYPASKCNISRSNEGLVFI